MEHLLKYHYYGGMAYVGLKKYTQALQMFTVVSVYVCVLCWLVCAHGPKDRTREHVTIIIIICFVSLASGSLFSLLVLIRH